MSIVYNGNKIKEVIYNGVELTKIIYNGVVVFEKKYVSAPNASIVDNTYCNQITFRITNNNDFDVILYKSDSQRGTVAANSSQTFTDNHSYAPGNTWSAYFYFTAADSESERVLLETTLPPFCIPI